MPFILTAVCQDQWCKLTDTRVIPKDSGNMELERDLFLKEKEWEVDERGRLWCPTHKKKENRG